MRGLATIPLHRLNVAVLDFETTGSVAGWPVEPWQLGLVFLREGCVVLDDRIDTLLRVAVDRPFNPHAPGRHAQLRDVLAVSPEPHAVLADLLARCSAVPLAAHNIGTERTLLARLAPLQKWGPWIDTLKLCRRIYPDLPCHALDDVVVRLGLAGRVSALCPDRAAHDAFYDAVACAVLLEHILTLPGWDEASLAAFVKA